MNELEQLKQRVAYLEGVVNQLTKSDRYVFEKNLQLQDGRNIQLGQATGTKIGTATTQKLAFYGTTPVVQFNTAFNSSASSSYGSTEQNIINALRSLVIHYGLGHS